MGNPDVAFGLRLGDRIMLVAMGDDPDPLEPGATGTVIGFHEYPGLDQVWVEWDCSSRSLHLLPGIDRWRKLD